MIGSCTLVVKKLDGSYRVHIVGLTLGEVKAEEWVELDDKYKNKPDADNLTDGDVYTILSARQCASKNQPHYSKFVGDRMWFLDLTSKSYLSIEDFIKNWETSNKKNLVEAERIRKAELKVKTRKLLKEVRATAKVFAKELVAVMEGRSTIKPSDKGHSGLNSIKFERNYFSFSQWTTDHKRVQFFAVPPCYDDHDLIRKHFDFHTTFFPKFLVKSGYEVTVVKNADWQNKMQIVELFAKKDGRIIHWDKRHDSNLELVQMEQFTA